MTTAETIFLWLEIAGILLATTCLAIVFMEMLLSIFFLDNKYGILTRTEEKPPELCPITGVQRELCEGCTFDMQDRCTPIDYQI